MVCKLVDKSAAHSVHRMAFRLGCLWVHLLGDPKGRKKGKNLAETKGTGKVALMVG